MSKGWKVSVNRAAWEAEQAEGVAALDAHPELDAPEAIERAREDDARERAEQAAASYTKIRETRLRRLAERQGLRISKPVLGKIERI